MNFDIPLVSVIIPLYNAEKYIAETIQNVLSQSYINIEILIIDDGSTDNSLSVAKKYENKKIKIFSQENKGASAARNYGLREANGDFIQFLDADDLISNNKIEEQMKLLVNNENKVAICPTIHFFDEEDISLKEIVHEWYQEDSNDSIDFLLKLYGGSLIEPTYGGMITIHAWLTSKKIIEKAGHWNEQITLDDDGEFFCRVLLASGGTRYSPNAINYYRKFKGNKNLSSRKDRKAVESQFLSTTLKKRHLLSLTTSLQAKKAIASQFLEIAISTYPEFKEISKKAEAEAFMLKGSKMNYYTHTPFYTVVTKLFGWKISAVISHYKLILNEKKRIFNTTINRKFFCFFS